MTALGGISSSKSESRGEGPQLWVADSPLFDAQDFGRFLPGDDIVGADVGGDFGSAYIFAPFEPIAWVYLPLVVRWMRRSE